MPPFDEDSEEELPTKNFHHSVNPQLLYQLQRRQQAHRTGNERR